MDDRPKRRCSFCGKHQDDVKILIAAPGVYICNECVDLSNEILTEELDGWEWYKPDPVTPEFKTPLPLASLKWENTDAGS